MPNKGTRKKRGSGKKGKKKKTSKQKLKEKARRQYAAKREAEEAPARKKAAEKEAEAAEKEAEQRRRWEAAKRKEEERMNKKMEEWRANTVTKYITSFQPVSLEVWDAYKMKNPQLRTPSDTFLTILAYLMNEHKLYWDTNIGTVKNATPEKTPSVMALGINVPLWSITLNNRPPHHPAIQKKMAEVTSFELIPTIADLMSPVEQVSADLELWRQYFKWRVLGAFIKTAHPALAEADRAPINELLLQEYIGRVIDLHKLLRAVSAEDYKKAEEDARGGLKDPKHSILYERLNRDHQLSHGQIKNLLHPDTPNIREEERREKEQEREEKEQDRLERVRVFEKHHAEKFKTNPPALSGTASPAELAKWQGAIDRGELSITPALDSGITLPSGRTLGEIKKYSGNQWTAAARADLEQLKMQQDEIHRLQKQKKGEEAKANAEAERLRVELAAAKAAEAASSLLEDEIKKDEEKEAVAKRATARAERNRERQLREKEIRERKKVMKAKLKGLFKSQSQKHPTKKKSVFEVKKPVEKPLSPEDKQRLEKKKQRDDKIEDLRENERMRAKIKLKKRGPPPERSQMQGWEEGDIISFQTAPAIWLIDRTWQLLQENTQKSLEEAFESAWQELSDQRALLGDAALENISKAEIKLVIYILRNHADKLYIYGGVPRDLLIGDKKTKDVDIALKGDEDAWKVEKYGPNPWQMRINPNGVETLFNEAERIIVEYFEGQNFRLEQTTMKGQAVKELIFVNNASNNRVEVEITSPTYFKLQAQKFKAEGVDFDVNNLKLVPPNEGLGRGGGYMFDFIYSPTLQWFFDVKEGKRRLEHGKAGKETHFRDLKKKVRGKQMEIKKSFDKFPHGEGSATVRLKKYLKRGWFVKIRKSYIKYNLGTGRNPNWVSGQEAINILKKQLWPIVVQIEEEGEYLILKGKENWEAPFSGSNNFQGGKRTRKRRKKKRRKTRGIKKKYRKHSRKRKKRRRPTKKKW